MMHVVYASDDKFAEILGVSLTSLYENNKGMNEIAIYVLDSGICDENKTKLERTAQKYNRKPIQWVEAKNISEELQMEVAMDRGSLSQYARLFVSSTLPSDVERVLYLDCDIIIAGCLKEFFEMDLQEQTIGAMKDAFSKWYRMNIDLEPEDLMFNSGVMLIDMKHWKEKKVEERLMKFISKKKGNIQQGDQGALNAVLAHETYCFDPKYNSVTNFNMFTYKELMDYRKPVKGYYSAAEVKNAVEHPMMIHFTTSFLTSRPWMEECDHPCTGEWLKYKAISEWNGEKLWDAKQDGLILKIVKAMPRWAMLKVVGLAQVWGRPMINKIKGVRKK